MRISRLFEHAESKLKCGRAAKNCHRYRANFVLRILGDIDLTVDQESVWDEKKESARLHYSAETINNSIASVVYLSKLIGLNVKPGTPLKVPAKRPNIPSFKSYESMLSRLSGPIKSWATIAYLTGLRHADVSRLTHENFVNSSVEIVASKTDKFQRFPIPEWAKHTCYDCDNYRHDPHTVLKAFKRACSEAKVRYITPQQVRRLSATMWEKARPGCGAVILGHALPGWSDATKFYLDPHECLFDGVYNLAVPECLKLPSDPKTEQIEKLTHYLDRLKLDQIDTLAKVAEGLAG